jgi:hypothetical protein
MDAVFTDFQRSDDTPVAFKSSMQSAERLYIDAPHLIFSATAGNHDETEWLSHFYISVSGFAQVLPARCPRHREPTYIPTVVLPAGRGAATLVDQGVYNSCSVMVLGIRGIGYLYTGVLNGFAIYLSYIS